MREDDPAESSCHKPLFHLRLKTITRNESIPQPGESILHRDWIKYPLSDYLKALKNIGGIGAKIFLGHLIQVMGAKKGV